jgi:hypothetical protein
MGRFADEEVPGGIRWPIILCGKWLPDEELAALVGVEVGVCRLDFKNQGRFYPLIALYCF